MHYFLVSPEQFSVTYSINPWMDDNIGKSNTQLVIEQWQGLKNILEKNNITVHTIPCQAEIPDMVFTANAAITHKNKVVIANFMYPERQAETSVFYNFFKTLYPEREILVLPKGIAQEGAGDALFDRNKREKPLLFGGKGYRSHEESYTIIREFLDIDVEILQLVHPEYYHLDISLAPLDGGHVMYAPQSFDDASIAKIEKHIPKEKRIILSQEDLDNFNGNAVNFGETVIVNQSSHSLKKELNEKGYQCIDNPISEFMKAGGGNKCLTLRLE